MQYINSQVSVRSGRLVAGFTAAFLTTTALAAASPRPVEAASIKRAAAATGGCSPHWDTSIGNPGMNGIIGVFAVLPDGDLVAGGAFTMAGGNPANRVARWDGSQWHQIGSGFDDGVVTALVVLPNGDLIAAGSFTTAGGAVVNRVARWDGLDWNPLGLGIEDGIVLAVLALPNGDLVLGGTFQSAGGMQVDRVARWDGSSWNALGDGIDMEYGVRALAYFDDGSGPALYAGMPGIDPSDDRQKLLRWDGATWSPVDGGLFVASISTLFVADDGDGPALFASGEFFIGTEGKGVGPPFWKTAKWDGSEWEPLGAPWTLKLDYTGGALFDDGTGPGIFTGYSTLHDPNGIAKWDGSWWAPVASGLDGYIYALISHDDGSGPALYVGGNFDDAGGASANYIVRWRPCPPVPPTMHHVPDEFSTIQAAIDAASDGEVIRVAPGTYNEAIDFLGKMIVLESTDGATVTTIDASGIEAPAVTVLGTQVGTTLRGFTVTGSTWESGGQGVLVWSQAMLTIDSCVIAGNGNFDATSGGGIFVGYLANVVVDNCLIVGNSAYLGGGIRLGQRASARVRDCIIQENISEQGGGIASAEESKGAFLRCTIQDNVARQGPWPWPLGGGAITQGPGALNFFRDCDFIGNSSDLMGGGLYSVGRLSVRNSRFIANEAKEEGGGMSLAADLAEIHGSTLNHNTALVGGGIFILNSSLTLEESVFCDNEPEHIIGSYTDLGGNIFADVCDPVPGDLNGDGVVDVSDMLILLGNWG